MALTGVGGVFMYIQILGRKHSMSEIYKTPDEWLREPQYSNTFILDPDGWDRSNFEKDWAIPLTEKEFRNKLMFCTVVINGILSHDLI